MIATTKRALLLIAGIAFCMSTLAPGTAKGKAPSPGEAEIVFSGLYLNGLEKEPALLYHYLDDYWLPFELLLNLTGLDKPEHCQDTCPYQTTIGIIRFPHAKLQAFDGEKCISFSDLSGIFRIGARFDLSLYGAVLTVPWQAGLPEKQRQKKPGPTPDVKAPESSLSFIRLEQNLFLNNGSNPSKSTRIESGGKVGPGVWDIMLSGDPQEQMLPERYHWTIFNNNTALRIGTGSTEISSLLGNREFTGMQFGINNRSIIGNIDFERYSDSDAFLLLDRSQQRTLEGNGPPAGIAELRIDNQVVARQRINLDGRFIFRNVRMTGDLRTTEVYLYNFSLREPPSAIIDFTQSVSSRSLPKGELMLRGGLGALGNPLDETSSSYGALSFSHLHYGLNNRITLEGGLQHTSRYGKPDKMAGGVLSLGKHWKAAIYASQVDSSSWRNDIRLEGRGRQWSAAWWSRVNNGYDFRATITPWSQLNLTLTGNEQYALLGAYWRATNRIRLSATPDESKTYRYDADIVLSPTTDLKLSYEDQLLETSVYHDLQETLSMSLLNNSSLRTHDMTSSLYLDWAPEGSHYNRIRVGSSFSDGHWGYSAMWNRALNPGLRFILQYSWNMNNAGALETTEFEGIFDTQQPPAEYLAFTLSLDLGRSGKRIAPINSTAISHTRGGIAGSFTITNSKAISSSSFEDIGILLNGKRVALEQGNGTFFAGNLRPGIYRMMIDAENLPLELNVPKEELLVEVGSGAITTVDIPITAEYGISGRITSPSGHGIAGKRIRVYNEEDKTCATTATNFFGYYRIDSLPPGTYRAEAEDTPSPKEFTITDDYLFSIDFTIGQ